jgi:hypothetical protein
VLNEEDLVPSGLFSGEPDKERRGFFEELARSVYPTKLAALFTAPTVPKNLYQESVLLNSDLQVFPDRLTTTACKFDWVASTGRNYEVQYENPKP